MKKAIRIIGICFAVFFQTCIIPKEARILKKTTKDWRESALVLHAYADTPLSGIFLTLRENGKFEYTSSGLFQSFEAGTWNKNADTISLRYFTTKEQAQVEKTKRLVIDRNTSTLAVEGENLPAYMRLRILVNKL
ncbi:MAG: hypothetical protein ACRCYO_11795 [Bacteroidia bacterium]